MKPDHLHAHASLLLLLAVGLVEAKHGHSHLSVLHRRHTAHRNLFNTTPAFEESTAILTDPVAEEKVLKKRDGQCQFPTDAGLVAVAPDEQNAGWAMSPDQPCLPGSYCPYACPPGQVSMQWDPTATSYSYPKSMNGGLYCDNNGNVQKPFPDKPYCQDGVGGIGALNKASSSVSFCQTVLPGNEAMLIPTHVEDWNQLAVPDTSYWCETAAHYYINPPGTSCDQACVWGTKENPVGNWSPYVAGGNTDASGNTFIKLGWNPVYLEEATPFRNVMPTWGVSIECTGSGCNGLPCAIDPSQNSVNEMVGSNTDGAGGGAFCVVTVPKGVSANFVVFEVSEGSNTNSSAPSSVPAVSSAPAAPATLASSSSTEPPSSAWSSTPDPSTSYALSSSAPAYSAPPAAATSTSSVSSSSSWWSWAPSSWSSSSSSSTSDSSWYSSSSSSSLPPPPLSTSTSLSSVTSSTSTTPALIVLVASTAPSSTNNPIIRPAYSPHILLENVTHIVTTGAAGGGGASTSLVLSKSSSSTAPIDPASTGAASAPTRWSMFALATSMLAVSLAVSFSE